MSISNVGNAPEKPNSHCNENTQQTWDRRGFFNLIKVISENPTNNIRLNSVKAFTLKSGTRARCLFLPHPFNIVLKVLTRTIT